MKNPNGYRTVVKLSGVRRNPFAVRKTAGFNEKGQPIYLNIGYTATKEEGLIMLAEFNKSPWNIEAGKLTFEELFNLWREKRLRRLGAANANALRGAYKYCARLERMKYKDIRSYHMQDCIDSCGHGYATQGAIKNLFRHLDRFALELDVTPKSYSQLLVVDPMPETTRRVFSDEEVERVCQSSLPWADSVEFLLYTGWRISEFLSLKISDVDLKEATMKGGCKTAAGKGRIVPIHSKIFPIVEARYHASRSGWLFEYDGKMLTQSKYRRIWSNLMTSLNMEHTPHECRHTLRTRLDAAGANKVCIDRIMGHRSEGTGERVYTHKTIEDLRESIELITN